MARRLHSFVDVMKPNDGLELRQLLFTDAVFFDGSATRMNEPDDCGT